MRIHQNVIRVAPLPSLLPAPAAPPNITRWGLHGRSPDRSNVRRGRRGKAGKPENPNPHTRVKVRMRNGNGTKLHGIWWGISLTAVIMDGRLACESIAESLCVLLWRGAGDSEHRAVWLASWHSGGEAFALLERIGQTASTRGASAEWPRLG